MKQQLPLDERLNSYEMQWLCHVNIPTVAGCINSKGIFKEVRDERKCFFCKRAIGHRERFRISLNVGVRSHTVKGTSMLDILVTACCLQCIPEESGKPVIGVCFRAEKLVTAVQLSEFHALKLFSASSLKLETMEEAVLFLKNFVFEILNDKCNFNDLVYEGARDSYCDECARVGSQIRCKRGCGWGIFCSDQCHQRNRFHKCYPVTNFFLVDDMSVLM